MSCVNASMLRSLAGGLFVAATACAESPSRESVVALKVEPSARLKVLGARARRLAIAHCGRCHGSSEHEGRPAALRIFDLRKPDWYLGLDAEQLEGALRRLEAQVEGEALSLFREFVEHAQDRVTPPIKP